MYASRPSANTLVVYGEVIVVVSTDRSRRTRRLLPLVEALSAPLGTVPRVEAAIDGVRDLLNGDVGAFNYVDVAALQAMVIMRPKVVADPSGPVQRTLNDHPIVRHYRSHPTETAPQRLSDHLRGDRADHRFLEEVLRPMGTPHQIVVPLPWQDTDMTRATAYGVTRTGCDFTDADLEFAQVLQAVLRMLHAAEPALDVVGRLDLLSEAERDVIELTGRGLSASEIAYRRRTKVATVRRQRINAYQKLHVHDRRLIASLLGFGATMPRPVDRIREIFD